MRRLPYAVQLAVPALVTAAGMALAYTVGFNHGAAHTVRVYDAINSEYTNRPATSAEELAARGVKP
jgi:uncharacterized protein (UPF0333 family)